MVFVLSGIQMIRSVGQMENSHLPKFLKAAYSVLALATVDTKFVRPGCVTSNGFTSEYLGDVVLSTAALVMVCAGLSAFGFTRMQITQHVR